MLKMKLVLLTKLWNKCTLKSKICEVSRTRCNGWVHFTIDNRHNLTIVNYSQQTKVEVAFRTFNIDAKD